MVTLRGGTSMVEQSLKYFEDRISSSLKPNGQDLRAVFSSETTK